MDYLKTHRGQIASEIDAAILACAPHIVANSTGVFFDRDQFNRIVEKLIDLVESRERAAAFRGIQQ